MSLQLNHASKTMKNNVVITIAIATFNRPEGLKKVLAGIAKQSVKKGMTARVVVADNSMDANAKSFLREVVKQFPFELIYHHITQQGVVYPRNKCLKDALKNNSDYLVFIDDDEIPNKKWLYYLEQKIRKTGAAVVSGGVKPLFEIKPSWWMEKGKFFEVMDYPENKPVHYAHTSNVIIDLDVVRNLNIEFDRKYNLSGGEDTDFFNRIREAGYDTYFTSEAWVEEEIVAERQQLKWLVIRWFRTGNTDAIIKIRKYRDIKTYLYVFLNGGARIVYGLMCGLIAIPLLIMKKPGLFECIRIHQRGLGFIMSLFNYSYKEYKEHNR